MDYTKSGQRATTFRVEALCMAQSSQADCAMMLTAFTMAQFDTPYEGSELGLSFCRCGPTRR
jgi:hypothetical protein